MRTNPRQTWLVPLLAVPLSHVALSPSCTPDVLASCVPNRDPDMLHRDAASIAALAAAVAASSGSRGLTDEEALLLLSFVHDYVDLGRAGLVHPAFLLAGMDVFSDLPSGLLLRHVAQWVETGALPVPLAAFITTRTLPMTRQRPMFLPRIDGDYTPLTRAIDHRILEQGMTTWEEALAFAHRFWSGAGWRDLDVWQAHALHHVETNDIYKSKRELELEELSRQRQRHRMERKRLQEAATQAQEEVRRLRPFRAKVDGLRAETERLRNREAELAQARDRAVAHAKGTRSESYLVEAQRLSRTGSFGWNPVSGTIYWSEETYQIFGIEPGTAPTVELVVQRTHPDDRVAVQATIEHAQRNGLDFEHKYRLLLPDGSVKHLHVVAHAVTDDGGRREFVGAVMDITERERAEEGLRESEDRFRTFVDHATDAFFLHNEELLVIDVNRQACASLGYSRNELIGMHPREFDVGLDEATIGLLADRVSAGENVTFESLHRRKDGTVFPVEVRIGRFQRGGAALRPLAGARHHRAQADGGGVVGDERAVPHSR